MACPTLSREDYTVEDIKEGDVVQLKSGSPSMTVNKVSHDGSRVEVVYHLDDQIVEATFNVNIIVKVK
jgi:hypothetical protein